MLFSCNSKSNSMQTRNDSIFHKKEDTTVVVQVVPEEILGADYTQKEYFVIMKNDTSSFSCVITKSKISGKMSMRYQYTPFEKIASSYSTKDTSAVSEHKPVRRFNHKLTYKEQIIELKLILKYALKDYDLSKLSRVSIDMSSINGLSQNILEKYVSQFGTIDYPSYQKVRTLIENSLFKSDLNNLLSPYSVIIKETFVVDGLIDYIPQDSKSGTKAVLNCMVMFYLIPVSR